MIMPEKLHCATRRELLLGSGVLFAWLSRPGWRARRGATRRFLTIVLRGALDGLAAVAPVGDPDWIKLRGDNALAPRRQDSGAPLDGFFALNPAMPNVHRLYQDGHATIVHAVATPYRERSHFDGQDVLEADCPSPARSIPAGSSRACGARAQRTGECLRPASLRGRTVSPLVVRGPAPVLSWTGRPVCPRSATRPPCASSISIVTPIRHWRACSRIGWE